MTGMVDGKLVCKEFVGLCDDGDIYDPESWLCIEEWPHWHCYAYSENNKKQVWKIDDDFSLFEVDRWWNFSSKFRAHWIEQIYDWFARIEYEERTIDDFRPMRSDDNRLRHCTNDESSIEKHSCEYTCDWNWGYVCARENVNDKNTYQRCQEATCNPFEESNLIGAINWWMVQDKPAKKNVDKYWRESRKYIEAFSQEDFESKVPNEWCYYRCPDELLRDRWWDSDAYRYLCYSSKEERDEAIEKWNNFEWWSTATRIYYCSEQQDISLYGYAKSQTYSYYENIKRNTYAQIWWFETNESRWCLEWCTNDATDVITGYNWKTICRKKCDTTKEYFDYAHDWWCKPCQYPWQIPNQNTEDWKDGNPTECVNMCKTWESVCKDCNSWNIGCSVIGYKPWMSCEWKIVKKEDWSSLCVTEPIIF